MESDILFDKATNKYNCWYKFIDKDKYNFEAYELFEKAKNKYIVEKRIPEVIKCLTSMINCLISIKDSDSDYDLCKNFEELGDLLLTKKINISKGLYYLNEAINLYVNKGEFRNVCKIKEKIGEYYKSQNDLDNAIKIFTDIKDLMSNNNFQYSRICKILFELFINQKKYDDAFNIYKELIEKSDANSISNKLLLNEIIYYSLLCFLIIDEAVIDYKIKYYCEINYYFENSRQYKFIKSIIESLQNKDINMFNSNLNDYNSVSTITNIEVQLLNEIKKKIEDDDLSVL